jgi:hypothetical protein
MQTTLLREELLDGQIAVTKAYVDATINILGHQGQLLQAVLEIPGMSVASFGQVSRTIFSTGLSCSLRAATTMLESFDPRYGSSILSKARATTPALDAKGGPRKTKAIAAA